MNQEHTMLLTASFFSHLVYELIWVRLCFDSGGMI